jgi:superfamily II DNA or RNA helicase
VAADRKVRSRATSRLPSNAGPSHGFGIFSQVIVETTGTRTSGTAGGFIRVIGSVGIPPSSVSHLHRRWRLRLVEDASRTAAICADVAVAVAAGRNCLVLTRWKEHLDSISEILRARGVEILVMHGQMGKKARAAVMGHLETAAEGAAGLVLGATASLIGEGFDCPPLDTLFLAFPIRFKGNVVQYVGRVLRPAEHKTRIEVHDYVDVYVPVLARMHEERRRAYASLGFTSRNLGERVPGGRASVGSKPRASETRPRGSQSHSVSDSAAAGRIAWHCGNPRGCRPDRTQPGDPTTSESLTGPGTWSVVIPLGAVCKDAKALVVDQRHMFT